MFPEVLQGPTDLLYSIQQQCNDGFAYPKNASTCLSLD